MILFTISSCIGGNVCVIDIDTNEARAIENLGIAATNWVTDSVGKNNFTQTLNDGKQIKEYQGFVLKYANALNDNATVNDVDNNIKKCLEMQINIYKVSKKVVPGWVFSNEQIEIEQVGYFGISRIDKNIDIEQTPKKATTAIAAQKSKYEQNHDNLMEELSIFLAKKYKND